MINNNNDNVIAAGSSYYVGKFGDRYVGNDGSLVDRQRDAYRMPADDRIDMMRAALDAYYAASSLALFGTVIVPSDRRLRLVRVNPKTTTPTTDAIVDAITNDRPHVFVIKSNDTDQYFDGSDWTDLQKFAARYGSRDLAQRSIDSDVDGGRIVRVNLKQSPIMDAGIDYTIDASDDINDDDNSYYNDDADRAIDTNDDDDDDRPFVYVVKNDFDQYLGSLDGNDWNDRQKGAQWFGTLADAQATIDRLLGHNMMRIVRVRLNSASALDRYDALMTPQPIDPIVDRKMFYVVKQDDLYLDDDGGLTRYQRKARRFDARSIAEGLIADNLIDSSSRIVKVNAR